MKKYFLLIVFSTLTAGLLYLTYSYSQSTLGKSHQAVLNLVSHIREVEASIEEDTLKARDFISQNYDALAEDADQLGESCVRMRDRELGLSQISDPGLDEAIADYCASVAVKLTNVELFKAKNAIMRNSLNYIQERATTNVWSENQLKVSTAETIGRELVRASVSYYLMPSPELKANLRSAADFGSSYSHKHGGLAQIHLGLLLLHAKSILANTEEVDELVKLIVSETDRRILDRFTTTYLHDYEIAEQAAAWYLNLLFYLCIALLLICTVSLRGLWKAARDLSEVNANLEMRVAKRTKELNESLNTISVQQTAMVASAKTSALGEMAGQAAHEINTPLGAIILTAESLKRRAQTLETEKEFFNQQLELILTITNRIARIIGSMRKMAGTGNNEMITSVNLKEFIEDTSLLCEGRFKKVGISFQVNYGGMENASLQCRSSEISQILINLLNNAFDAINGAPAHDKNWIRLEVRPMGDRVALAISDSGPGIAIENRTRIFETNFTTKSLDHGTGFGLAISRKLALKNNGSLELELGEASTTFILNLPLDQSDNLFKMIVNG